VPIGEGQRSMLVLVAPTAMLTIYSMKCLKEVKLTSRKMR